MKEVKSPKKPLIFYYLIVLGIILLFNVVIAPLLSSQKIVDVDYGTWGIEYVDGTVREFDVAAGAFA